MTSRLSAFLGALLVLSGCSTMDVKDFKNAQPRLFIEEYFAGHTTAWGIFEDRFGNLRRQFTVDIEGTWDGEELVLDERFLFSDGEVDRRIWHIRKTGDHSYEGRADDVIGVASGESYGNALNWRYDMNLKVGDSTLRVHFDDWMYLQPSSVLMNKATVTKLGIEIGRVTLVFLKDEPAEQALQGNISATQALHAAMQ